MPHTVVTIHLPLSVNLKQLYGNTQLLIQRAYANERYLGIVAIDSISPVLGFITIALADFGFCSCINFFKAFSVNF